MTLLILGLVVIFGLAYTIFDLSSDYIAKKDFCSDNGFEHYEANKCFKFNENSIVSVKNIFCADKKCYFTKEVENATS